MANETSSVDWEEKGKSKKLDPTAPAFKPRSGLFVAPLQPVAGSQHCGIGNEPSSRALRIIGIPLHFSCVGQELTVELSAWGPIRALHVEPSGKAATVYYFDLRCAMAALADIKRQHVAYQCHVRTRLRHIGEESESYKNNNRRGLIGGKAVWAQYAIAVGLKTRDRLNQGSLVLFNIDATIPNALVQNLFEKYGSVKEVKDGPSKRQHKFVEFFDCRDAALALHAMDGQEIAGRRVKIQFSCQSTRIIRNKTSSPPSPFSSPPMSANCQCQGATPSAPTYLSDTQPPVNPLPAGPSLGLPNSMSLFSPPHQYGRDNRLYQFIPSSPANSSPLLQSSDARVAKTGGPLWQRRGARNETDYNSNSSMKPGNAAVSYKLGGAAASKDQMDDYMFKEAEAESGDGRRTLMVCNIPSKYSQEKLLALLDEHCGQVNSKMENSCDMFSAYDFFFLPMDFKKRCNLGYAFVNFTTSQATTRFHKVFDGLEWEEFQSRKVCKVTYAHVQGRTSLEHHFWHSRFVCDTDEFLPRVFDPPRTGLEQGRNGSNSVDDGEIDVCESGSTGEGWTEIGIVLGQLLSGHLVGELSQGERCGRVM